MKTVNKSIKPCAFCSAKVNWKDTVIKNKDIQWKHPKIKYVEDGKIDFILTLPLTHIIEMQAKRSFLMGIMDYNAFIVDLLTDGKDLDTINAKLKEKLIEYGFRIR